jgi:hypothetical protein
MLLLWIEPRRFVLQEKTTPAGLGLRLPQDGGYCSLMRIRSTNPVILREHCGKWSVITLSCSLILHARSFGDFAVGGHWSVAGDVLEDVALAREVKESHRPIRFRYAADALSTRMYRTTREMIEGWTKNLAVLFPRPIYLAAWRVLDFVLYFGLPALALGVPWLVSWQRWALLLIWARTLWRFYTRAARSNFAPVDVGLSILGIPLLVFLLVRSTLHHRLRGEVKWKGRSYRTVR